MPQRRPVKYNTFQLGRTTREISIEANDPKQSSASIVRPAFENHSKGYSDIKHYTYFSKSTQLHSTKLSEKD